MSALPDDLMASLIAMTLSDDDDAPRFVFKGSTESANELDVEHSHFDRLFWRAPPGDVSSNMIVGALAHTKPTHPVSPILDKKFGLKTFHKLTGKRPEALRGLLLQGGPLAHLGCHSVQRIFNAHHDIDPEAHDYLIFHYKVKESDMYKVLREVEQLNGFLGSRLPLDWLHSPFFEKLSEGPHLVLRNKEVDLPPSIAKVAEGDGLEVDKEMAAFDPAAFPHIQAIMLKTHVHARVTPTKESTTKDKSF